MWDEGVCVTFQFVCLWFPVLFWSFALICCFSFPVFVWLPALFSCVHLSVVSQSTLVCMLCVYSVFTPWCLCLFVLFCPMSSCIVFLFFLTFFLISNFAPLGFVLLLCTSWFFGCNHFLDFSSLLKDFLIVLLSVPHRLTVWLDLRSGDERYMAQLMKTSPCHLVFHPDLF